MRISRNDYFLKFANAIGSRVGGCLDSGFLRSYSPGGPHGLLSQTVGFVVAHDMFGVGIELQRPSAAEGDVGQVVDHGHVV